MLYEDLVKVDILRPLLSGFEEKRFRMLVDGQIEWKTEYIEPNTPWIFVKVDLERNCNKWLDIYHEYYGIIPKTCRKCWKVAFQPKTLVELFKVYQVQTELDRASKCGIEMRPISSHRGGYSAFWYVPLGGGLKEGRSLFEFIKIKLETALEREVDLILKRGCTEMERQVGVSDRWDERAEQFDFVQEQLDQWFVDAWPEAFEMPGLMKIHTQRMWIEWAYQHGDETYKDFSNSFPGGLLNYARSDHKERDFR